MQHIVAIILCVLVAFTAAAPKEIKPTDTNPSWRSVLQNLQAGDVVTVHEGTYTSSSKLKLVLVGTATNPIVIQGASGEARPVFKQTSGENVIDIDGEHFMIKGLEFTGGSRGVRLGEGRNTSHAIFDSISIHDIGANGFSANDHARVYENITLRYSEIYNTAVTGECVYMGCQTDGCRTFNSIIEFNYCHDTTTDGHGSKGSGYQVKTGSYNNIIRNNVCKNTAGVCILLYDDYDRGVNLIEGNVVIGVQSDNGIQVTAGAILRNNIILGWATSGYSGLAVISNEPMPGKSVRNIVAEHNTIYNAGSGKTCTAMTSIDAGENWVISNNAFYCPSGTAMSGTFTNAIVTNNGYLGTAPTLGSSNFKLSATVAQVFAAAASNNLYPAVGSALIKAGDSTHSTQTDFNGLSRGNPPTVGAYEFSSDTNPGWSVQGGIKQLANGATPLSNTITPATPPPATTPSTGSNSPSTGSNGPSGSSSNTDSPSSGASNNPSSSVTSDAVRNFGVTVLLSVIAILSFF